MGKQFHASFIIRWVEPSDVESWTDLAREVAILFGFPGMPGDPDFLQYMTKKISQHEALIAIDPVSNQVYGVLGFSRRNNRISWFAVSEKYRRQGVGSRLLHRALEYLDLAKDLTVTTFADFAAEGHAARQIYRCFGFVETIPHFIDENGLSRSIWTLPANSKRIGKDTGTP